MIKIIDKDGTWPGFNPNGLIGKMIFTAFFA
jgi:hypothetical protein